MDRFRPSAVRVFHTRFHVKFRPADLTLRTSGISHQPSFEISLRSIDFSATRR